MREQERGWLAEGVLDATENEDMRRKTLAPLFNAALYRVLDVAPLYAAGDECLQDYSLSQCELEPLELPCDNEVMGFLAEVAWTAGEAVRELHYLESDTREIVALLDRENTRPD